MNFQDRAKLKEQDHNYQHLSVPVLVYSLGIVNWLEKKLKR